LACKRVIVHYSLPNELLREDNSSPLLCSAGGRERLCWSPWPCEKCGGGVSAVGYIVARIEASSNLLHPDPEEVVRLQISWLKEWVQGCRHQTASEILLPRLAEGSEHVVFLDAEHATVFKITRRGIFGESYYLVNDIVHQRNCSPIDYLLRLRYWKKLFHSAPRDLGITDAGQIVSTHEFITGNLPTQESVDEFLISSGLTAVKKSCWLWKRSYNDFEIWLGDARADNFVQNEVSIVPIDIRVWFATPE
jgi:hypothetical protein